jgi:hypothetical protein
MAWAATQLNDRPVAYRLGEPIQELAVKRLGGELARDLLRVVRRNPVISRPRVLGPEPASAGRIAQPPPPTGPVGRL